jgi:virulence-associated protein VagC
MAFPHKTELLVIREGDRIIIEPKEKTLGDVPKLFHALNKYFVGERPDFDEDVKRDSISRIVFPYLGIDMSDYAFNREELNAR